MGPPQGERPEMRPQVLLQTAGPSVRQIHYVGAIAPADMSKRHSSSPLDKETMSIQQHVQSLRSARGANK